MGGKMHQPELSEEIKAAAGRLVESEIVPGTPWVASLGEFIQIVFGEDTIKGNNGLPLGVALGIEKMGQRSAKHYRLIWIGRRKAALAAEDSTEYRTKTRAIAAGAELAAEKGACFDPKTR